MQRNSLPDRGYLDLPSAYYPEYLGESSPSRELSSIEPPQGLSLEQSNKKLHRHSRSTSSTASYSTASSVSPRTTTFPHHARVRSLGGNNSGSDIDVFADAEDEGPGMELGVLSKWAGSIWRRASETFEEANFDLKFLGLGAKSEMQREEERWFGDLVDFEAARRLNRRRSSTESFVEGVAFAGCAVLAFGGIWWVFS